MTRSGRKRAFRGAEHELDLEVRTEAGDGVRTGERPVQKRTLNEAAHKLGDWAPPASDSREDESDAARRRFEALADSKRDVIAHAGRAALALGALGVVYGDIGTSPLYTEQVIFSSYRATAHVTPAVVLRRRLIDLLGADGRRVDQVRGLHHARAQPRRRRHHGADGAAPAQPSDPSRAAGDARDLRRGAVLRRRHHHPGDLGPRFDPGGAGRHSSAGAPGCSAVGRDPDRAVRAPAVRIGHDRTVLRPRDPRLVHRDRRARPQRGSSRNRRCSRAFRPAGRCGSCSTTALPAIWCSAAWCWR